VEDVTEKLVRAKIIDSITKCWRRGTLRVTVTVMP
jgi:hypothetical protein